MSTYLFRAIAFISLVLLCLGCSSAKNPIMPNDSQRSTQNFTGTSQIFVEGYPDPEITFHADSAVAKYGYGSGGSYGFPYIIDDEAITVAVTGDVHYPWFSLLDETEGEIYSNAVPVASFFDWMDYFVSHPKVDAAVYYDDIWDDENKIKVAVTYMFYDAKRSWFGWDIGLTILEWNEGEYPGGYHFEIYKFRAGGDQMHPDVAWDEYSDNQDIYLTWSDIQVIENEEYYLPRYRHGTKNENSEWAYSWPAGTFGDNLYEDEEPFNSYFPRIDVGYMNGSDRVVGVVFTSFGLQGRDLFTTTFNYWDVDASDGPQYENIETIINSSYSSYNAGYPHFDFHAGNSDPFYVMAFIQQESSGSTAYKLWEIDSINNDFYRIYDDNFNYRNIMPCVSVHYANYQDDRYATISYYERQGSDSSYYKPAALQWNIDDQAVVEVSHISSVQGYGDWDVLDPYGHWIGISGAIATTDAEAPELFLIWCTKMDKSEGNQIYAAWGSSAQQ